MLKENFLIKIEIEDIDKFETFQYCNFIISQEELNAN
jgi:hypothetical protein